MGTNNESEFERYLNKFIESDWQAAVDLLLPSIHKVDQNAVQIWFRFYPLSLYRFLAEGDRDEAKKSVAMQGEFGLDGRIDTSHNFLYGSRYWKTVKAAIEAECQVFASDSVSLTDEIKQIATMVADKVKADASLLIGITAVGLMTLVQVGREKFNAEPGDVAKPTGLLTRSPDAIVKAR